jgi:dienelactone hydrolase
LSGIDVRANAAPADPGESSQPRDLRAPGLACGRRARTIRRSCWWRWRSSGSHGFHADYRASYRKDAADDAWNQMQAWFRKYKVLG